MKLDSDLDVIRITPEEVIYKRRYKGRLYGSRIGARIYVEDWF